MKLATYARIFEFASTTAENVRLHAHTGFRYLDLSFFRAMRPGQPGSFLLEDGWRDEINAAASAAKDLGLAFAQIHAPFGNPMNDEGADALFDCTVRSLEAGRILGAENAAIHAGSRPGATKEEVFEKNRAFFQRFFPVLETYGVNLLVENVTNSKDDPDSYRLTNATELKEFVDYVGHPMVQALWDTGHARVQGLSQHEELLILGKRLRGLHVAANNSLADDHLPPMIGGLDLDSIIPALLEINYPGYFNFEVTPISFSRSMPKHADVTPESPLYEQVRDLCVKGVSLMHDIGKCALSVYGIYEG